MKIIEMEVLKYVFIQTIMNNYQHYFKDISEIKWKKCTEISKIKVEEILMKVFENKERKSQV